MLFAPSTEQRIRKVVDDFLARNGLAGRRFAVEDLVVAVRRSGLDVTAEAYPPTKGLRGVLVAVGDAWVIFYPAGDPVLGLVSVAHEVGHLLLKHRCLGRDAASQGSIYGDAHEQEAELFARLILDRWHMAGVDRGQEPRVPARVVGLFRAIQG